MFQGLRMLPAISLLKQGLLPALSLLKQGYKGYKSTQGCQVKRVTNVPSPIWNRVTRVMNVTNPISSETGLQGFMNTCITNPISSETQGYKGYECYQPYLFWKRDTRVTNVTRAISSETGLHGLQILPTISLLRQGYKGLWMLPTIFLLKQGYKGYKCSLSPISSETGLQGL